MNRYLLPICILLFSLGICAQEHRFHIDGIVDSKYNDSLVTLFTFTGSYIRSVDSTYVSNGRFHFDGSEYLSEKSIISLGNYPDTVLYAEPILERGNILVELKHNSKVYSPIMVEYRAFNDSLRAWRQQYKVEPDSVLKAAIVDKYNSYCFEFKKKHLHNALGRKLLLEDAYDVTNPHFDQLYEMLSDRDKSRGEVISAYKNREKDRRIYHLQGKPFIDFTLVDSLGHEKRISDYVGKYDLLFLDFWASWCGPCRAQEPHLAEMHKKYKEKGFEILGISLDTNRKDWLSLLKKKEKLWPELCIATEADDKQIRELYSITGIPTGFLIDKSGKVIHVIRGWQQLEMILSHASPKKST